MDFTLKHFHFLSFATFPEIILIRKVQDFGCCVSPLQRTQVMRTVAGMYSVNLNAIAMQNALNLKDLGVWKKKKSQHSTVLLWSSDLDDLAAFHLHQMSQVLLQKAGVGAPLEQAQQVHWEKHTCRNTVRVTAVMFYNAFCVPVCNEHLFKSFNWSKYLHSHNCYILHGFFCTIFFHRGLTLVF